MEANAEERPGKSRRGRGKNRARDGKKKAKKKNHLLPDHKMRKGGENIEELEGGTVGVEEDEEER
jgi:hypothetical protein